MKIAKRARLEDLFTRDWGKFAKETGLTEPYIRRRAATLADQIIVEAPQSRASFDASFHPAMQAFEDMVVARAVALKEAF